MTVRSQITRRRRIAALATVLAALAASAPSAALAATSCHSGEHFPEAKVVLR